MTSSSNSSTAAADWLDDLHASGAVLDAARVLHFGDPDAERAALAASPTLHPLLGWSVLRAAGADAGAFLQAQLSNDIGMLDAAHAQLSTYCTAQGRVLATLLLWQEAPDYFLQLPTEIAGSVRARLQKHILRAAVTLTDATPQLRLLGLGGPGASAALTALVDPPPAEPMAVARGPRGHGHSLA